VDEPDQTRDFLVSYTQARSAWVEWLAWELEAAGYATVLQAWDMPPARRLPTPCTSHHDHPAHPAGAVARVPALGHRRGGMAPGVRGRPQRRGSPTGPRAGRAVRARGAVADRIYLDLVGTTRPPPGQVPRGDRRRVARPRRPDSRSRFPRRVRRNDLRNSPSGDPPDGLMWFQIPRPCYPDDTRGRPARFCPDPTDWAVDGPEYARPWPPSADCIGCRSLGNRNTVGRYAASGTARALASAQASRARIARSAWSATRSMRRTRRGSSAHSCLSRPFSRSTDPRSR
jgi:hypothetical protein